MAFRGRGRGRGFGRGRGGSGGFDRFGKPEPFVLFPEVIFPKFPTKVSNQDDARLVHNKRTLEAFWKNSCYHLEDASEKSHNSDRGIQRYSDKLKQNAKRRRENLVYYLKLIPSNFPSELIQGSKRPQASQKKLRWDKDVDSEKLEILERLESSGKSKNEEGKEKKGDDEDDEQLEEADDESSDDGDYNQNRDFDDDEDDLNMEEEPDEDTYD